MASFNSFRCPKCERLFPLVISPSMRINRGLLTPFLKCRNCGQISRQKIDFPRAVWIWPITVGVFGLLIYAPRYLTYTGSPVDKLFQFIAFLSLFPFFLSLRSGMKLVVVEDIHAKQNKSTNWFMPLIFILLFSMLFGYYTHDWSNVVIGLIVGILVWAVYFYLSRRN